MKEYRSEAEVVVVTFRNEGRFGEIGRNLLLKIAGPGVSLFGLLHHQEVVPTEDLGQ